MTLARRPSLDEIAEWVRDFEAQRIPALGRPRVLPQDDADDEDAFVVIVHLEHVAAAVYLQLDDDLRWIATLTQRPTDFTGTSLDLIGLGAEVEAAGHLCAYLQRRTHAGSVQPR